MHFNCMRALEVHPCTTTEYLEKRLDWPKLVLARGMLYLGERLADDGCAWMHASFGQAEVVGEYDAYPFCISWAT
jgi:hypothetical protein